jgi:inner membrane protein
VVVDALVDEPAHLLTAWLLWCALAPRSRGVAGVLPWVLVGAVAIDLDHLPLYLGPVPFLVHGGRPPTHSLLTVGALLLVALLTARSKVFVGLAVGVVLHLVRDLATGPGVPLWWPFSASTVTLPFAAYGGVLGVATVVAALRRTVPPHRSRRTATRAAAGAGAGSTGDPRRPDDGEFGGR